MRFASWLVNVRSRLCNPVVSQVAPVTPHRIAMNSANMVVSSHHRAGKTFQNDGESSRCDVEAAGLEPDTIRVRNPETVVVQAGVSDEVFAAPSIRIEAVGEIAEGSDRHKAMIAGQMSSVRCQETRRQPCYFFSESAGAVAGRSEFQISAPHFHLPSACFSQTSTYLPRSVTGLPLASIVV